MKFNNKSDYSLNKKTDDIVYSFADGKEIRYRKTDGKVYIITDSVTMTEVSEKEMSADEFDRIKAISNEDYHEDEKHSKRITRENVSINKLMETACVADKSAEQEYFNYLDMLKAPPQIRTMENAIAILDKCLTETQKRRFLLMFYNCKSSYEIAELENRDHKSILESINAVHKKLTKYFSKNN